MVALSGEFCSLCGEVRLLEESWRGETEPCWAPTLHREPWLRRNLPASMANWSLAEFVTRLGRWISLIEWCWWLRGCDC